MTDKYNLGVEVDPNEKVVDMDTEPDDSPLFSLKRVPLPETFTRFAKLLDDPERLKLISGSIDYCGVVMTGNELLGEVISKMGSLALMMNRDLFNDVDAKFGGNDAAPTT